jgi:hypothetical protein
MAPAAIALAIPTVVLKGTVIPVTLDLPLSSATGRAGAAFLAHHTGINGGGFPEQTEFTGNIDSVTQASGKVPGQIGVSFVSAQLPDGTRLPIVGEYTSLGDRSLSTDAATGGLEKSVDANKANLKAAGIGAGAGLVLGQIVAKKPLIGTILGAAAGYLYQSKQSESADGEDVQIPAGTRFGILLTQDVTIPDRLPGNSPGSTVADSIGSGWEVTFKTLQPVMRGDELMLPFRSVMNSIDIPFDYDTATKQISVTNYEVQSQHTVGTRIVNINGKATQLGARSRLISGSIYVPASYVELLTSRTASWNEDSRVLRIQ